MITETTGNEEDWVKEARRIELGAEHPTPPSHPSLKHDSMTSQDFLSEIVAENVKASQDRINYHE